MTTATSTVPVGAASWALLGTGPLIALLLPPSYGVYVALREQDAQPTVGQAAHYVLGSGKNEIKISEGAQVWAICQTAGATVNIDVTTGLEVVGGSGGSGGGGGAMTVADGGDVALGATGDVAYSGSGAGTSISLLKWIGAKLASTLAIGVADGSDVTQGAKADAAYAGSGAASVIAALKGLYAAMVAATPAGSAIIGKVGIDQTTPGVTNAVSDTQSAPFQGAVAMVVGTAQTAQRSVGILATAAGNVAMTLADASTITLPVYIGWQTFPFAATAINSSGTTATATYFNLK